MLFTDDCLSDGARKIIGDLRDGQIALLENLRFHPGEEKNDENFARSLAKLADVYVNDAFGAAHRAHASVAALPKLLKERGVGLADGARRSTCSTRCATMRRARSSRCSAARRSATSSACSKR